MRTNKHIIYSFILAFVSLQAFPQCRVSHLNGTMNVNGINVTVTHTGDVDTVSTCNNMLGPYWIGVHYSPLPFSCNGGRYNFSFVPSVSEVFLNFGSINSEVGNSEIVRVYLNGSHYPIPSPGDTLSCQQLAILTVDGDIASPNWDGAAWKNTKITGAISTLSIQDSILAGCGNGAIFSLSLCNWAVGTNDIEKEENKLRVYPNPTNGDINIFASEMLTNGSLKVINITGEPVLKREGLNGMSFSFDLSGKADGVYIIEIKTNKGIKRMKLVKQ